MKIGSSSNSNPFEVLLFCSVSLIFLSGVFSSAVVTIQSIEIFKTHEWLNAKPTIYFRCQGDNRTILPDVTSTHTLYKFKGEESWQPVTELDKKCKRCGLYERDAIEKDDVFEEWEFCPSDFTAPNGIYIRYKDYEFNATFVCPQCLPLEARVLKGQGMNVVLVVLLTAVLLVVSIFGAVVGYQYWQRRKRERDQARFLKLFEDDDELEDELGLGPVL